MKHLLYRCSATCSPRACGTIISVHISLLSPPPVSPRLLSLSSPPPLAPARFTLFVGVGQWGCTRMFAPPPGDAARVFVLSYSPPPPPGSVSSFPVISTPIAPYDAPLPPVDAVICAADPPSSTAMAHTLFSVPGGRWHIPPAPRAHNHQFLAANSWRAQPSTRLRAHSAVWRAQ